MRNLKIGNQVFTGVDTLKVKNSDNESELISFTDPKEEQEKSVTVTENGTTQVLPDDGKVLSKVMFTANVQPNLQEKSVTPTTTAQEITADAGNDGLSKVIVDAVTASIDDNIAAQNIKKDITILGITGTLESGGGIEDVATADEMNALLVADNVGKVYRFTGTTDSTYTNGDLYEVVRE